MDSSKKTYHQYLFLIMTLIAGFLIFLHGKLFHWWDVTLIDNSNSITTPKNLRMLRIFLVASSVGAAILTPSISASKNLSSSSQKSFRRIWFLLTLLFILGYLPFNYFSAYNEFLIPFLVALVPYFSILSWTKIGGDFREEDPLATVNSLGDDDSFRFPTDKGELVLRYPFSAVGVIGNARAGKSGSIVYRSIDTAVSRGWSGVLYELKGESAPISIIANNAVKFHKRKNPNLTCAIINFVKLENSVQVNPISPKYIKTKLDAEFAATALLLGLKQEWAVKESFWSDNAIAVTAATIWRIAKEESLHWLCNLPSVITLISSDEDALVKWLFEDEETKYTIRPIYGAMKRESGGQVAGVFSTVQLALNKMMIPELFWVFHPEDGVGYPLNIRDPENQTMLTISNSQKNRKVIGPSVSVLLTVLKSTLNVPGGNDLAFYVDEKPSVYIHDWDQLPADGRSNRIMTLITAQNRSQIIRAEGKDQAESGLNVLGSWFIGTSSDMQLAKEISSHFSQKKIKDSSYSTNSNDISHSEKMIKTSVLESHEISGLKTGELAGWVQGGDPSRFKAQFEFFDAKKIYPEYTEELPKHYPKDLGDEELNKIFLHEVVKLNYENIISRVEKFLEPYQNTEENGEC